MKKLITLLTLCLCFTSCKNSGGAKGVATGIEISYFTKDFFTYINSNGWVLRRGGLYNGELRYIIEREGKSVEILISPDKSSKLATSLEIRYPLGDRDSELLLKDIFDHIEGAQDLVTKVDNTK